MVEFVDVKFGYLGTFFIIGKRHNGLQASIIRHRVTIIVQAHTIITNAVNGCDIALVLCSASSDKCIPLLYAYVGPVGYYENDIIVISRLVARPNRETQVVANKQ